jgi:hypothetical protein
MDNFKGALTVDSNTPTVDSTTEPLFKNSFDTSTALAGMYLWLLFGFFSSLLGCDLQRTVTQNMYVKHLVALVTFFFLMTVIDSNNKEGIAKTWLKTIIVYLLFLMSTKSKLLASVTVLLVLVIDQTIKIHMQYLLQHNKNEDLSIYQKVRDFLYLFLIIVIVVGYIHYFIRARREFGQMFEYKKFIFGTNACAST